MNDEIQQIKDKIDVVDLIKEYVQLKPAGVNQKGLCPFHHEKSPSFMVNGERQSWHCFGCQKGGDIFTFVEEMEGMEFKETLKYLADKAGVVLTNRKSEVDSSQKNRIKEINRQASRFFYNFLLKMNGAQVAREYVQRRELKQETIDEWQIGFISDQWDLLTQYLLKKGCSIDDLVASGLTIKRDNADPASGRGFYDRFRGRVMFPIWDAHDAVVGFTGRVLVETEHSGGKYVNTPQTLVYDKSRVVFGLNKAKQEIKAKNLIVMVEGQMDVIACHQAGMKNVVATSGTALTENQIKLLKRYSENINIAFDADTAGIDIALAEGMNIKIIQIPEGMGKDPDECIKKNKDVWYKAVGDAQGIMEWYFKRTFAHKNVTNPKDKQTIVNSLLPEISRIPFAVERDHWLQQLSEMIHVDMSILREDAVRLNKVGETKKPVVEQKKAVIIPKNSHIEMLLSKFFAIILRKPEPFSLYIAKIPEPVLSTSSYLALYQTLKMQYTDHNSIDLDHARSSCSREGEENIVDILLMQGDKDFSDFTEQDLKKEIEQIVSNMKNDWLKEEGKRLQEAIRDAEKSGDKEKMNVLMEKFQALGTY
jgi:DNA primase